MTVREQNTSVGISDGGGPLGPAFSGEWRGGQARAAVAAGAGRESLGPGLREAMDSYTSYEWDTRSPRCLLLRPSRPHAAHWAPNRLAGICVFIAPTRSMHFSGSTRPSIGSSGACVTDMDPPPQLPWDWDDDPCPSLRITCNIHPTREEMQGIPRYYVVALRSQVLLSE